MSRILVAVDGSEAARRAAARAAELAVELAVPVLVLHVLPPAFERDRRSSQLDASQDEMEEAFGRDAVEQALAVLRAAGVHAEALVTRGTPARVILDQTKASGAVRVVVGTRGRSDLVPEGSTSLRVSRAAQVPVDVVA